MFDTIEKVKESIIGEFKGNPKTRFGGAHHKIIENGLPGENFLLKLSNENDPKGLTGAAWIEIQEKKDDPASVYRTYFTQEQYKHALKYRIDHPVAGHEIAAKKIYRTKFGNIQVSGIIDVIEGCVARDAKNTFRVRDDHEYTSSCQSKFYMSMLEIDRFIYDIFLIENFEVFPSKKPNPDIIVNAPYEIPCLRYKNMEHDLIGYLNDVLEYINDHKLWDYLKEAKEEEILPF